ncbi:MAG: hypothetical protein JKY34_08720 [Kordiimonadaceae bacterium]|nr:hypothetical protein [Kordiimonadaceae bacterium]
MADTEITDAVLIGEVLPAVRDAKTKLDDAKRRISTPVRRAINLMVTKGMTQKDAAQEVGIAPETLSRNLSKDHVKAMRRSMVQDYIDDTAAQSAHTMNSLATSARSEKVRFDAAQDALDRGGYGAEQGASVSAIGVTINIDLSGS